MRCKVEWHGVRCEKEQGHGNRTHRFVIDGVPVTKKPRQVVQSSRVRRVCNTGGKSSFRDPVQAKLFCIKVELETGTRMVPYSCPCGSYHLTGRYDK